MKLQTLILGILLSQVTFAQSSQLESMLSQLPVDVPFQFNLKASAAKWKPIGEPNSDASPSYLNVCKEFVKVTNADGDISIEMKPQVHDSYLLTMRIVKEDEAALQSGTVPSYVVEGCYGKQACIDDRMKYIFESGPSEINRRAYNKMVTNPLDAGLYESFLSIPINQINQLPTSRPVNGGDNVTTFNLNKDNGDVLSLSKVTGFRPTGFSKPLKTLSKMYYKLNLKSQTLTLNYSNRNYGEVTCVYNSLAPVLK